MTPHGVASNLSSHSSFKVIDFATAPSLEQKLDTIIFEGKAMDHDWVASELPVERLLSVACQVGDLRESPVYSLALNARGYREFIGAGGLNRTVEWIRSLSVSRTEECSVSIPIAEVHHPRVEGCSAWMEHDHSRETKHDATIKLVGFGGGATARADIEVTDRTCLTGPPCVEVLLPVDLRVGFREAAPNSVVRVDITHLPDGPLPTREIAKGTDRCELTPEQAAMQGWKPRSYPLEGGKGTKDFSEKMGKDRGFNGQAGLSLGLFEAAIQASVTWSESSQWGYTLVLGRTYLACRPNYAAGFVWPRAKS